MQICTRLVCLCSTTGAASEIISDWALSPMLVPSSLHITFPFRDRYVGLSFPLEIPADPPGG